MHGLSPRQPALQVCIPVRDISHVNEGHLHSAWVCLSNFAFDIQNHRLWISEFVTCARGWCVRFSDLKQEIVPLNLISHSVPFLLLCFIFICLSLLSLLRLFNQMQTLNEGFPAISKQSQAIPLKGEEAAGYCAQTQDSAAFPPRGEREVGAREKRPRRWRCRIRLLGQGGEIKAQRSYSSWGPGPVLFQNGKDDCLCLQISMIQRRSLSLLRVPLMSRASAPLGPSILGRTPPQHARAILSVCKVKITCIIL